MPPSSDTPIAVRPSERSTADELINAATHAFGLLLSVVGVVVMSVAVAGRWGTLPATGCAVYMASLMAVYAMSTLSHLVRRPYWKSMFRRLDQAFIYILIAATYTPFSLAFLHGAGWTALLSAIWVVAVTGFAAKLFFGHRIEAVSITSYVILGWLPIMAAPALSRTLPMGAFYWMILGGVCYTVGTIFLIFDERVRHFHAVWHLCVIAGSTCHFLGILFYVVAHGI